MEPEILAGIGATIAAIVAGFWKQSKAQQSNTQYLAQTEQIEHAMLAQRLEKISSQLERVLDTLDRIADSLRQLT